MHQKSFGIHRQITHRSSSGKGHRRNQQTLFSFILRTARQVNTVGTPPKEMLTRRFDFATSTDNVDPKL
jgi:hypothetical protein